jgi:hypothetical protein
MLEFWLVVTGGVAIAAVVAFLQARSDGHRWRRAIAL